MTETVLEGTTPISAQQDFVYLPSIPPRHVFSEFTQIFSNPLRFASLLGFKCMMDSLEQQSKQAAQEEYQTVLWSPTRPNRPMSQPESLDSAASWATQYGPMPPELRQAQEEFAAALEAECDRASLPSGSSGHDDQGAIASDLKKALPALLQENVEFRERLYAQSDIEEDANPTANFVHEKIVQGQFRPRHTRVSRLPIDMPSSNIMHEPPFQTQTPPTSPPFRLPHFSSRLSLTAEQAPRRSDVPNSTAMKNLHLLDNLRMKEVVADPLFAMPLPIRPRLPDTASANEIVFLLKTQAQRRRMQIHNERTGKVG